MMCCLRCLSTLLLLASLSALNGCQTTTGAGEVGADRQQFMVVSSAELEHIAAQGYAKLRTESARKGVLNTDAAMLRRVHAIASRLEPQTGIFRPDAPAWKWEVNVIASKELNAFCMPGGKIMVYSGLVNQLRLTDDEIAIMLGHEISHALREHSRERVSQALAAQAAIGIGAALLGAGEGAAELVNTGYEALIATRFSRTQESEADRIGLELAARAGYDPHAGVSAWQDARCESGRKHARVSQHAPRRGVAYRGDRVLAADGHAAL
ncbi:MAG: M48 family metallopeptidase [Burkholderiales bacterium]